MTWGGVRGGIAIVPALSISPGDSRGLILSATCLVVLLAVLEKGLTLKRLVGRITGGATAHP